MDKELNGMDNNPNKSNDSNISKNSDIQIDSDNPKAQNDSNNSNIQTNKTTQYKVTKQWWFWVLIALGAVYLFVVSFAVFGGLFSDYKNDTKTAVTEEVTEEETEIDNTPISESELDYLYSDPDTYEGRTVKLKGRVFGEVEKTDDGIGFQMFADPNDSEKNTIVYSTSKDISIKDDDYVEVEGTVMGEFEGENAFGGDVEAITVNAYKIKKSSYEKVVDPAQKRIKINATANQRGYKVTLKKVEIGKDETRVYLKVKNNGSAKFELYPYSAKIIQGSKQFEEKTNYDADYKELPDEIDRGVKASGVISFPKIKKNKNFTFKIECSSDNYDEDLSEFVYNVNVK